MTHESICGPAGKLDFGYQFRSQPYDTGFLSRGVEAGERRLRRLERLQLSQQLPYLRRAKTRPHAAYIDETIGTIDPDQERPKFTLSRGVAADDDLVSRTTFRLHPSVRPSRYVGRIATFRHDSFKGQTAGRAQNRLATVLEMLDEANSGIFTGIRQKLLQSLLAVGQR